MSWQIKMLIDPGARTEQQDRVGCYPLGAERYLLVLADGMGGQQLGAQAAAAVLSTAAAQAQNCNGQDPESFLLDLCQKAHLAIRQLATDCLRPPGSTCVFLYLDGQEAYWAHVGDSRLYHFRHGQVVSRTKDHSLVEVLVSQGRLKEEEMANSPIQNRLYMALGSSEPVRPQLGAIEAKPGDGFLLCSDGLWEQFAGAELAQIPPEDWLQQGEKILAMAVERGGSRCDNVSLIYANYRTEAKRPWYQRWQFWR